MPRHVRKDARKVPGGTVDLREGINVRAHRRSHGVKQIVYTIADADFANHTVVPWNPGQLKLISGRLKVTTAPSATPPLINVLIDGVAAAYDDLTVAVGSTRGNLTLFDANNVSLLESTMKIVINTAGDAAGPATLTLDYVD